MAASPATSDKLSTGVGGQVRSNLLSASLPRIFSYMLFILMISQLILHILLDGPPCEHELHREVAQDAADHEDVEEGEHGIPHLPIVGDLYPVLLEDFPIFIIMMAVG